MNVSRRSLVRSAASSIALSTVGFPAWPANVPVRISLEKLSADKAKLAQFRKLFSEMRKKKASDPGSYFFQGAVHWFPDLGAQSVANRPDLKVLADMFNADPAAKQMLGFWNQCTHLTNKKGSWDFLLWHRAYLYYFELHARKTLGDPTFAVPYWDYKASLASRKLPAIFAELKADGVDNPLLPLRGLDRDLGGFSDSLDLDDVDTSAVMGNDYFFSEPGIEGMGNEIGFRTSMDAKPHGSVHGGIGGWMGSVTTAAFDPVFWVHHANIDRLFNVWLSTRRFWSRTMPKSEVQAWLATSAYTFYDASGKPESKIREFFLNQKNLGYAYDSDPAVISIPDFPPQPAIAVAAHAGTNPMGVPKEVMGFSEKAAGGLSEPVKVSAASGVVVRVPLAVPPAAPGVPKGNMPLAVTNQSSHKNNRTILELSGVKKAGERGGNYGVFVGPDAETAKDTSSPSYAGRFSSFEAPDEGGPAVGATFRFNITSQIAKLDAQSLENLIVRIVPMPKSTQLGAADKPGSLVVNKVEIKAATASTDPLK
jgi:hypothetical protein